MYNYKIGDTVYFKYLYTVVEGTIDNFHVTSDLIDVAFDFQGKYLVIPMSEEDFINQPIFMETYIDILYTL